MGCACKRSSASSSVRSGSIRKSSPSNNGSRRSGRIVKRMIK